MADTLKEDREGQFSKFVQGVDHQYVDNTGVLSKAMLDEIRDIKQQELHDLEEKLLNSRIPAEDLFGIKRRMCTVCESSCAGYEPNTLMVPVPGEFPTFCKLCKCPAHFHKICISPQDIMIPEEIKETFLNHNI